MNDLSLGSVSSQPHLCLRSCVDGFWMMHSWMDGAETRISHAEKRTKVMLTRGMAVQA